MELRQLDLPPRTTGSSSFVTTRWSIIARSTTGSEEGRRALGELCTMYWYPLYAYARRHGADRRDAEDLVQDFLRSLIERGDLATLDASRGRFRAFLLASLRNFLNNDRARRRSRKRGGGHRTFSMDSDDVERRYQSEILVKSNAESVFERSFALELITRCLDKLAEEWHQSGRSVDFARLAPLMTPKWESYRDVGTEIGMSEAAVKMAVHRMRRRLAAIIRNEIREVVLTEDDIDEEINALFAALARGS